MILCGYACSIMNAAHIMYILFAGSIIFAMLFVYKRKIFVYYLIFPFFLLISYKRFDVFRDIISEKNSLDSGVWYEITGTVSKTDDKGSYVNIYLKDVCIGGESCGEAYGTAYKKIPNVILRYEGGLWLIPGDVIGDRVKLTMFDVSKNPGNFDMRLYYGSMNIKYGAGSQNLRVIKKNDSPWMNYVFEFRERVNDTYRNICTETDAGVLSSIVTGDKSALNAGIKELYQKNGIGHILAISGLHISIIGMGLYKLLRRALVPFLPCFAISTFLIVSYGMMTGNSVSTIRAVTMFIIAALAAVLGKEYDILSALGLSGVIILLKYPGMMYNSGFYLSFLAVLGISTINPVICNLFVDKNKEKSITIAIGKSIMKAFISSCSVNILTIPVILWSYFEFPVYSVFLNILILPLMSFLMISAVLGALAGMLYVPAGAFFIGTAHYILRLYEILCNFFERLPFAVIITGKPGFIRIVIYYFLIFIIMSVLLFLEERDLFPQKQLKQADNANKPDKIDKMCVRLAFVLAVVSATFVLLIRPGRACVITVLDVDQGDCIHINTQEKNILIDGGSTGVKNVGQYRIIPYLKSQGVRELDYVIISHADADHVNGIKEIIKDGQIGICEIIMPDIQPATANYEKFLKLAEEYGIKLTFIDSKSCIVCGKTTLRCVHPVKDYVYKDENDYSANIILEYKDFRMMFTGDVGEKGESSMIKEGVLCDADIDVLKVAHHGSKYSGSRSFLELIKPEAAVISCGAGNSYGHPHKEAIERLTDAGTQIYRTDEGGAVIIDAGGEDYVISNYAAH